MKKFISMFLLVSVLALMMIIIPSNYVQAKNINTLEATQSDGRILVSGTAEEGTLAVAIVIYDETGENLITMETTSVEDDNTYFAAIDIEEGNYLIKVADYDGGEYITTTVSPEIEGEIEGETKEEETTVPEDVQEETPAAEVEESNTEEEASADNTKNPATGDNIVLYIVLFIIAGVCVGIIVKMNGKKKKKNKIK